MKHFLFQVVVLLLGSFSITTACAETKQPERYNVLMLAVDDLNDWVSVLNGHPEAETPNFDRLPKTGNSERE